MLVQLRGTGRMTIAICIFSFTTGCLNLGGKTTYVQESPDSNKRLAALESRVTHLEQTRSAAVIETIPTPTPPLSLEP